MSTGLLVVMLVIKKKISIEILDTFGNPLFGEAKRLKKTQTMSTDLTKPEDLQVDLKDGSNQLVTRAE